jgi:hypothetical protein
MKNCFLLISFSLLLIIPLKAQIYCQSTNGVNLREAPNQQSKKVGIIPFGAKIDLDWNLYSFENSIELNDRAGIWLPINYKGTQGYAFSPFFGKLKLNFPRKNEKLATYFIRTLDGYINDTIVYSLPYQEPQNPLNPFINNYKVYKDGTICYDYNGYESNVITFSTNAVSTNELFNLLKIYHEKSNLKDVPKPSFKNGHIWKETTIMKEAILEYQGEYISITEDYGRTMVSIDRSHYYDELFWIDIGEVQAKNQIDADCFIKNDTNLKGIELVYLSNKNNSSVLLIANISDGNYSYRDIYSNNNKSIMPGEDNEFFKIIPGPKRSISNLNFECLIETKLQMTKEPIKLGYLNGWHIIK